MERTLSREHVLELGRAIAHQLPYIHMLICNCPSVAHCVSLAVQGVSAAASGVVPASAAYMDGGHFAATRELSPRSQAVMVMSLSLSSCMALFSCDLNTLLHPH